MTCSKSGDLYFHGQKGSWPGLPQSGGPKSEKSNEAYLRKVGKTSILGHCYHISACPRRAISEGMLSNQGALKQQALQPCEQKDPLEAYMIFTFFGRINMNYTIFKLALTFRTILFEKY